MRFQKRAHRFRGDIATTRERDVRMPGTKVRLQARSESGVMHALVQLKEMRVCAPNADPDYFGPAFGRKSSYAADGKKERRDFDRGQGLAQFRFSFFSNVSKETES